ncbi:TonB-dependent receptor [Polluticoccus soli]|uniref:TonB-dependent receptor n=1 Tax=Polluticoccus soli TaxID=3034150 RepID=UPI0023E17734|nr:TonB-dependent receptor [Flavipsychrobacter sp. JY13-12]
MKNLFTLIGVMGLCTAAHAQTETDSIHPIRMDQVVISANKFNESKKDIAQPLQLITRQETEWAMPQTTASLLEQTGNVFVQRSQMGGGSAVIRGFEASRVLMVVDGVRMNNAIYRAGHLQNIITIDNNLLESTEILYGPASTLYGSDALGGVIVFNTKNPVVSGSSKTKVSGNAMTRYSTANHEKTAHVDLNLGLKKIAFLTSVTYSDFDDLRQGTFRNPFYGSLGLRDSFVTTIDGVDNIVANDDNNIQKFSGYNQVDVMEKILFRPSWRISHTLNLQYSNSSNIPRYDRLTDMRNGRLRYAEWYYGPQLRMMGAYQFHAHDLVGFFDEIKAGASYQRIQESRYQRSFKSKDLQARIEDVDVIGYNVDFRKEMKKHELTLGTDGQYNKVKSTAHIENVNTAETTPLDTRYPDGGSNMLYAAVYGQHLYKINSKLVLNDGVRLNYTSLKSKFEDQTFFPFPFSSAEQNNLAWSGNLGLVYMPAERWRFAANSSTGFRAPNVDDMVKVFESTAGGNLIVPNPDLKPEYTYNVDLGINYIVDNTLKLEASGFYTWFRNAIVTDKFTLNGADSVEYDGKMTAIFASQNKARACLYGFNAAITAQLMPRVTLYSTINFTYGRYFNAADKETPLDHIPPVFGKTSIIYREKKFTGEVFALYNGMKRLKDYSASGEDNLAYATAMGMPGWYTLNLRAGYQVHHRISAEVALENILDYNYRVFASGLSAPGRNLVVTLRGNF